MGTLTQKIYKLLDTKNNIKDILLSKDAIDDDTPFAKYPEAIRIIIEGGAIPSVSNIITEIAQEVSVIETIESSPCLANIIDITASIE